MPPSKHHKTGFNLAMLKMSVFDVLGTKLHKQLIFVVHLGPARTNPTEAAFKFNRL